jgi:hypothetical protein
VPNAKKTTAKKTTAKKTTAKKTAGSGLRAEHVLTLKSRATFEALSPADRQQLAATGREGFGQKDAEAMYAWLEREEMSFFKLRLVRGGVAEWDVWINTAKDDGVVFAAGSAEPAGIGISQEDVHDETDRREALCAEIEKALRGFALPKGMKIEDLFWEE